jgi:quinol monooxygenase YgiN
MPAVRLAVRVEVGEPVELREAVRVVLVHHVDLDLAEAARETRPGSLASPAGVEQQHLVREERRVDCAKRCVVDAGVEVDAEDLGAEVRREASRARSASSRAIIYSAASDDRSDAMAGPTVVAKLRASTGKGDALAALLVEQCGVVRATEPGCVAYRLHRADGDPDLFLFYEAYVDDAAFETHRRSPHLAAFRKRAARTG